MEHIVDVLVASHDVAIRTDRGGSGKGSVTPFTVQLLALGSEERSAYDTPASALVRREKTHLCFPELTQAITGRLDGELIPA